MAQTPTLSRDFADPAAVPYFFWDRAVTVSELRAVLATPAHPQRLGFLRTLLREARPDDVWHFVTPAQVAAEWAALAPGLGRRRAFWEWLLDRWRALGLLR